jgi:GNAT superfamily N-acetyltransferase
MKPSYFTVIDVRHGVEVDLIEFGLGDDGPGWTITRVITPQGFRGQGRARELMKQVLADADAEGVVLWLEINPYGDMTFDQLEVWYERLGFTRVDENVYRRDPKEVHEGA